MSDHPHAHLWPGVPLALLSAVLFGASAPASKLLLMGSIDPQLLAGLLYLGAGAGLAAVQAARAVLAVPAPEAALRRADVPWLAAVVLVGGIAAPLLLMLGLRHTPAASASLLLNLEGLATMAIAWIGFRENVDARLLVGAAAILCGAVVLAWPRGAGPSIDGGSALVALACLAWGLDNNLTRRISAADPVVLALVKGLVAGTANLLIALGRGAVLPPAGTVAAAAALGFGGIGVSLVLFVLALRHLGTARTGAYFSLAPFIGALLAVGMLGEPVTAQFLGAGLLMAFGLSLHLAERHSHEHLHEGTEHEHVHVHDQHHRHSHGGPVREPHVHWHRHAPLRHAHVHFPDLHHRHRHEETAPLGPDRGAGDGESPSAPK